MNRNKLLHKMVGLALTTILVGCGAPAPAPPTLVTGGDWEMSVESATTESQLDVRLGVPFNRTSSFYLDDPSMTFLVVGFSLRPMAEDNTLDMQEIIVTHGESGRFYPIGLCIGSCTGEDWKIRTSGACQLEVLSETEVTFDYDFYYEADNDYGIENDDLTGYNESAASTVTLFQPPMVTFAYVIPSESIDTGQLWLEVTDSQPVRLEVVTGD